MKTIKALILGSAASLLAMGGAQAADLPVKVKAVEYVKVCSLYGAGFYYIPGTDTCLKIGGFLRVDTSFNSSGTYAVPFFQGAGLTNLRNKDYFQGRVRANLNMDTRTATEYGVVRTFVNTQFQWSDASDGIAGGTGYAIFNGNGAVFGQYMDAVFASPGGVVPAAGLQLSTDFSARIFYEHYWNPAWRTSLYGIYARHENTGTGNAILMQRYNATYGGGLTGDANFSIYQVGSRTAWTPVKNLTFSAEVQYAWMENGMSGTMIPTGFNNRTNPVVLGSQGTLVGSVQALRSF